MRLMAMIKKLFAIIDVLYQGKELSNKAKWKRGQQLTNAVLAIVGGLALFLPEQFNLSKDDIIDIAKGIIAAGVSINGYLTPATTTSIGFKSK